VSLVRLHLFVNLVPHQWLPPANSARGADISHKGHIMANESWQENRVTAIIEDWTCLRNATRARRTQAMLADPIPPGTIVDTMRTNAVNDSGARV
jgi:hypothetical protein